MEKLTFLQCPQGIPGTASYGTGSDGLHVVVLTHLSFAPYSSSLLYPHVVLTARIARQKGRAYMNPFYWFGGFVVCPFFAIRLFWGFFFWWCLF